MGRNFSDEEIKELTHRWESGESASEIGARLGRSRNSILGCVHRIGLNGAVRDKKLKPKQVADVVFRAAPERPFRSSYTEEDDAELRRLCATTMTSYDIAALTGRTRKSVMARIARLGISRARVVRVNSGANAQGQPASDPPAMTRTREEPEDGEGAYITDLERGQCRWPRGQRGGLTTFCGCRTREGKVYCDPHLAAAFRQPSELDGARRAYWHRFRSD